jgi:hypothetical protein
MDMMRVVPSQMADDDNNKGRWLESGDNGDDYDMSTTTMGYSLSGYNYAVAVFDGKYCDAWKVLLKNNGRYARYKQSSNEENFLRQDLRCFLENRRNSRPRVIGGKFVV